MSKDKELFNRLVFNRMHPDDVNQCLKMSQREFLEMICDGIEHSTGDKPTRVQFADMTSISPKTVYSYFASPDARDYRALSDDSRIAMLWRLLNDKKLGLLPNDGIHRGTKYLVNGVFLSPKDAASKLGYANRQGMEGAIKRSGISPGGDISSLINKTPGKTITKSYVVNGEVLSMNKAAISLGYNNGGALYAKLRRLNITPGSDISHLKPRRFNRRKNKNET